MRENFPGWKQKIRKYMIFVSNMGVLGIHDANKDHVRNPFGKGAMEQTESQK